MTSHHFPFQLLSLLRDTRGMLIFREFEHLLVQRAYNSILINPQNKKTRLYENFFGDLRGGFASKRHPRPLVRKVPSLVFNHI